MFCYQCEQTAKGTGCEKIGVCGKQPDVAALQDLLLAASKSISMYAHRANVRNEKVDRFVTEAFFTTITNVNFDPARLQKLIQQAAEVREIAKGLYSGKELDGLAKLDLGGNLEELIKKGEAQSIALRKNDEGEDVTSLKELITYGLKGMAAYLDHARILGQTDESVFAFFHEASNFLTETHSAEELTGMALKVGEVNIKAMELLDHGNTGTYGHPEPTQVRITTLKGKCILVSGHDLKDLEELLKQTEGKGINVYTHGEMLPCNAYPELKNTSIWSATMAAHGKTSAKNSKPSPVPF